MKKLKLLNKIYFAIIIFSLLHGSSIYAEEPVDIWKIDENLNNKVENSEIIEKNKKKIVTGNSVFEMQSGNNNSLSIEQDETLVSKETQIIGLYDPAKNGLDINMWENSDGYRILDVFNRIEKINLSQDAAEILNILLLTNSYYPKLNISREQFLNIKSRWLIKNSNIELIEEYLLNNQIINDNVELAKYLVNYHLARSNIEQPCRILLNINTSIEDQYLSKFKIYCLINNDKKDEAQLLLDLKKELGFKDKFFEKKFNYLMGYTNEPETTISEKTILDFHLSHRTNPDFNFEPKDLTSKQIWKYLSTSNLLNNTSEIELNDIKKIQTIEKATHERNYSEKEMFDIYKRFQFNINQLLNIKESSKVLTNVETRALIYQGILITSDTLKKLELINALKNSFKNDKLENAFQDELKNFLKAINQEDVPANYVAFYEKFTKDDNYIEFTNIRINNKILHQSKLVNYFKENASYKKIDKDLKELLRKIKKNKKYFFSMKDVILVESLKSDGIEVPERYKDLYELNDSEIPSDIKTLIKDNDMGVAMLRIVEFIGQDRLIDIDPDTMYLIINTLNQLNVDPIRNKILFKVLPLKV